MRKTKLKLLREAVREVASWTPQRRRELELYLMTDLQRQELREQSDADKV